MDTEPTNPSREALSKFVGGVEEKTRGEGEHHVAILRDGDGTGPTQGGNEFTSREALGEWADTFPPQDTVITLRVVYADADEYDNGVHPPDSNRR